MRLSIVSLCTMLTSIFPMNASVADPVSFEFRSSGERIAIRAVYVIREVDHFISENWIFTNTTLIAACSPPAIEIFEVDNKVGAINGTTATLSDKIDFIDASGARFAIEPGRNNRDYVKAGLVKADASDPEIGSWLGALTQRLRSECDNN